MPDMSPTLGYAMAYACWACSDGRGSHDFLMGKFELDRTWFYTFAYMQKKQRIT